jgi:hypothetical protein
MMLDVPPFDAVFDGTVNFVPRAVLDLTRADVPRVRELMQNRATHGEDGLDAFDAVPLVLTTDDGKQRRFALWRHENTPRGQVAIQLPVDEEFQDALARIMTAMQIPAAALIWLDRPIP